MIRRMLAVSAVAATALVGTLAAPSAEAAHVNWNVSIGLPGIGVALGAPYGYGYGYDYGYVAPRPVYYYPAPAYGYYRPPIVVPRPVYVPYRGGYHPAYRPDYWGRERWENHRR
ncbi:MAG: hypothetical protein ABI440_01550 [Casimicrobiaceae bacterium]